MRLPRDSRYIRQLDLSQAYYRQKLSGSTSGPLSPRVSQAVRLIESHQFATVPLNASQNSQFGCDSVGEETR